MEYLNGKIHSYDLEGNILYVQNLENGVLLEEKE